MEIKKHLKSLDVKISKLAIDLGVSRPTLDTYIECFEKGEKIPNEAYNSIFEFLFSNEEMNTIEFAQKYDYVKRVMLSDAKKGVEKNILEEREKLLLDTIKNSLEYGDVDKSLLEFICLFVTNKNVDLVKAIYMYFNYSNGYEDMNIKDIDNKDKALFSNLAKIFEEYQQGTIENIDTYYNQVFQKNQRIFERKKVKVNDTDIVNYIKNNLNENSDIDIEVLKKMIESREE